MRLEIYDVHEIISAPFEWIRNQDENLDNT